MQNTLQIKRRIGRDTNSRILSFFNIPIVNTTFVIRMFKLPATQELDVSRNYYKSTYDSKLLPPHIQHRCARLLTKYVLSKYEHKMAVSLVYLPVYIYIRYGPDELNSRLKKGFTPALNVEDMLRHKYRYTPYENCIEQRMGPDFNMKYINKAVSNLNLTLELRHIKFLKSKGIHIKLGIQRKQKLKAAELFIQNINKEEPLYETLINTEAVYNTHAIKLWGKIRHLSRRKKLEYLHDLISFYNTFDIN